MYDIKVDSHTHTIFSGHAYGTIEENIVHGAKAGMEAVAMTDHFGFGGKINPINPYSSNMSSNALPNFAHGIRILAGVEIDIADFDGNLVGYDTYYNANSPKTICETVLGASEMTIASLHAFDGFMSGTAAQYTTMYCNVAVNPGVDVIGHCERCQLPFDIDELLKTAKLSNTLIEINEHSFDFEPEVRETCKKIALRCAELDVPVIVGSDAHSSFFVGKFDKAIAMLSEIHFPEKLIANLSYERLAEKISKLKILDE